MIQSPYTLIDTPALLIDLDRAERNIRWMQNKADAAHVALRPHTKTHKMPYFAKLQIAAGAKGVSVAKVGEAEVMADAGIRDIFIATQVMGETKMRRIRSLVERGAALAVGVDSPEQITALEQAFECGSAGNIAVRVRIEVEVGENRSGVLSKEQALALAEHIKRCKHVRLDGIFCHEGHAYKVDSIDHCKKLTREAQECMIGVAAALRAAGHECGAVSIGSTPSMLLADILPGVTEIRPGTYIFMDAAQGGLANNFDLCAATVLATVTSLPTPERVILDTGAKALTAQTRPGGLCDTPGLGLVKNSGGVRLSRVFDEHGIILDKSVRDAVRLGDKLEIIPNHVCPVVNLYDAAWLVRNGEALEKIPVAARGRTQ